MKIRTLSYSSILFCILLLWSACKEDADAPLRFYDSKYEVPMGGRRYLGIESGNEITHWKLEMLTSQVPEQKPAGAEFLPDARFT